MSYSAETCYLGAMIRGTDPQVQKYKSFLKCVNV
jgi:hypothetical protein